MLLTNHRITRMLKLLLLPSCCIIAVWLVRWIMVLRQVPM